MKFKFLGIQNFNIKKFSGIFIYSYNNRKIKFLSSYNSLFISKDKEFSYNLKKLISKGINIPLSFIFSEKRKLYKNLVFSHKIRKLLLTPLQNEVFNELNKKIETILSSVDNKEQMYCRRNFNIKNDIYYKHYSKLFIDYDGFSLINKIFYNYEKSDYKIFYYCSSLKKSKLFINGISISFDLIHKIIKRIIFKNENYLKLESIENIINNDKERDYLKREINVIFNELLKYKVNDDYFSNKNILYIEGFPYWDLEKWERIIEENNFNYNDLRNSYFYSFSYYFIKKYYYDDKDIPLFIDKYFSILFLIKLVIYIIKIAGFKVIVDDSYTCFRVSPILEYFNYYIEYFDFFNSIKNINIKKINFMNFKINNNELDKSFDSFNEEILNSFSKNEQVRNIYSFIEEHLFDYYLFGSNLLNGLNFNLIFINENSKKDILSFNINDVQVFQNKILLKLFKIFYLKLLSKNYYQNFYFYLDLIFRKILKQKKYSLIGPYINIYNRIISSDKFNNECKIKKEEFFNKKEKYEKNYTFSFYNFGVIPLKLREQDFKSIISLIKK